MEDDGKVEEDHDISRNKKRVILDCGDCTLVYGPERRSLSVQKRKNFEVCETMFLSNTCGIRSEIVIKIELHL